MKEVSCKVIGPVLREAERRKIPLARLTRGTECTVAHLRNGTERIHWDEFLQIMANARLIWTDDEMIVIGERITASATVMPITLAARLLFSARDFYLWINKGPGQGGGGLLFTNMHPECREVGPNRLEIDLLTQEGYPLCHEFYLLTLGAFMVVPTLLGLPRSVVTMEDLPRGVRYHVQYPSGGGLLRKTAKAISWPFAARAMAKELMEANEVLEARYLEIERARLALALQATKLRTANVIAQNVHGDLDLARTLATVTQALVEQAGFARACVELDAEVDGVKVVRSKEHGEGGVTPLERELEGRGGHRMGRLTVFAQATANRIEREELLAFIVPSVAMALDNAISYLVVEEYRRRLELRVEERTAELREARDALAETVRDLEEAKEVRERIFANVNHDLRSPLSLVLLAANEARRADGLTPGAERALSTIEHGARRVLRLVDELLILAEGREGKLRLTTSLCDLGAIVGVVAEAWKPAAEAAGLALDHSVAGDTMVRADPEAIERIVANLLSNAIKFTPKGGRVDVRVSSVNLRTVLEVEDDGPGIDPELEPRLFGRFERGDRERCAAIGGSGLGLSLVKELALAHGGSVRGSSRKDTAHNARRGAVFRVELPLVFLDEKARPSLPAAAPKLRPADYGMSSRTPELPSVYDPPKTPRATILLAEDDPDLRDRTARLLSTEYRVLAAPDGLAAIELAHGHSPDLLVTDIAMPKVDGIELTKRFRALPNNRMAPVLVLTTFGGIGDRLAGFEAGAVDYIHKPFEPAELHARVRSQLALRSLALQLIETEKLAALGTLSAGLAHELRNPANGIINAVGPLREHLPPEAILPDTPAAQLLDIIEHCSRQVACLSRELLGFKRGVEITHDEIPIEKMLRRAKTTIQHALEGVEFRENLDYRGPVRCAEPLFAQVLTNLLENGAHAAGRGGWVEVRTGREPRRVVVEFTDSGPGVPEELAERIFEPFFTTKPAGGGTGLGLSTAREIVLRHGGTLDVRRASGRSVFRLEMPLES